MILVATSVAFNFITKPNLPAAISEDLDVTGRMHSVTSQVMQVVPLKSLEKLEPLVGKKRSLQMIKEAESLRSTLSDRIASETGKTADNIVTNALPAYLFGQVDEDGFRDQLAIDLGAVRGDVEAALTASGSLVVNAICEAIEAQIDTAIAPLSKQVNSQVSLDSVITAVNLLEARLDQLRAVVKEIRQYVSLIEANNPTSISNRLKQLEKLCETVIDTARKRIKDLEKAPADTGWSSAMQQLNADLQVPVRRYS